MKNRIYLQGFEDGYPFVPTSKEVIYMPFAGSAILNSFFERNLEWVKALFKEHLHYEFIFIPDVVKSYIVHPPIVHRTSVHRTLMNFSGKSKENMKAVLSLATILSKKILMRAS